MQLEKKHFWERLYPFDGETPSDYLNRLIQYEIAPEPSLVPETMYWGLVGGIVVGRLGLRHSLNEKLKVFGGHIGYEVHPNHRQKGYASEMLRRALKTPEALQIKNILLTCSPQNIGSNKTILSNGGVLEKISFVDFLNEDRAYYWIKTESPSPEK